MGPTIQEWYVIALPYTGSTCIGVSHTSGWYVLQLHLHRPGRCDSVTKIIPR